MNTSTLSVMAIGCALSGCTIVQKIDPVPQKLDSLCVEKNDDIFMDDYLSIIERNLTEIKVSSQA